MRTTTSIVALLLAATGLMAGCGEDGGSETPRGTLQAMADAAMAGDTDDFVKCFDASDGDAKILRALCEYGCTAAKFKHAMTNAYGETDAEPSHGGSGLKSILNGSWLDDAEIEIRATVTRSKGGIPMELVFKDGKWRIVTEAITGGMGQNTDAAVRAIHAMSDAHKEVMPSIGQKGKTAMDIRKELGDATHAALNPAPDADDGHGHP